MRLIDADALPKYDGYALSADAVARAVEDAPTVDAVPVVRCKDCAYSMPFSSMPFSEEEIPSRVGEWRCDFWCVEMHVDDYCSYGERREDASRTD